MTDIKGSPVAIIGSACRFPGAESLEAFRHLLVSGKCGTGCVPPDRWSAMRAEPIAEGASRWGGLLEDFDMFDADFFRIASVEAKLLDPQQRWLLECSWSALEDAGIDISQLRGSSTGVLVGIYSHDYAHLVANNEAPNSLYISTGSSASTAAGRVAYTLGLEGPTMAIDTASSSSLVAVHQAVTALQSGEADLALAGGVNAVFSPHLTKAFERAGMLSPDGQCKTFDARANGYVRGEGCGMIVLKRLSEAEADGDRVRAVIRGSAINQDGASNGLTVPNGSSQQRVIRAALERAGVAPAEVDYLEAHGTGTALGDPIEIEAAAAVYGEARPTERPLLVGSVKTNLGHLESAAGIAGLIKVMLALESGEIPRHLNFEKPSPHIDWASLPVWVTTEATPWPQVTDRPPRAGVSSFGFSGTNAHLVLEGYTALPRYMTKVVGSRQRMLPLSGRSEAAVRDLAKRYLSWLDARPKLDDSLLADMAWTASTGRSHFKWRSGLVFEDESRLRKSLAAVASGRLRPSHGTGSKIAFLFTGQGSQWAGMGQVLYEREPVVRDILDRCDAVFRWLRGRSLLDVMFGSGDAREEIGETSWTQPALYALGVALAELWREVGVRPDAVIGHSVGEIAAAHVAGVFSLEDGMRFATRRGAFMGGLPRGGLMAAVFASADRVAQALVTSPEVSIAADNGSHQVISGDRAAVSGLADFFRSEGLRVELLATSHAFHSALMEPMLDSLAVAAEKIVESSPSLPLVSNVTGRIMEEAPDATYWRQHARGMVAFAAGVRTLASLGMDTLVEVGPHAVLAPLAQYCWPEEGNEVRQVTSLARGRAGTGFCSALAEAYEAGIELDLASLFKGESPRPVSLPTYPFQRKRYWFTGTGQASPRPMAIPGVSLPARSSTSSGLLARLRQAPAGQRYEVLTAFLQAEVQSVLEMDEPPAMSVGLFDLGMDSMTAVKLKTRINRELDRGQVVASTLALDYPNLEKLTRFIAGKLGIESGVKLPEIRRQMHRTGDAVAIIGAACRFPGSQGIESFREFLRIGGNAIDTVPESRSDHLAALLSDDADNAGRGLGAFIDQIDQFDAAFFQIAPVEAELLDPQQRLLLESCWEALEDAGINPRTLQGSSSTGVYAGLSTSDYRDLVTGGHRSGLPYAATGNSASTAVGRIAYSLGLEGPAIAIDTACSSSLVAIHQAVTALQSGEADLVLAGGVNAILSPHLTLAFERAGMLSPDGQCKTFDARANGYVRGEGCGMVVLRRLSEAEADGDRIRAVIRGSAINQDGASAGLTVPNGSSQESVIRTALERAKVAPSEIDYLEAHGTGTALGDPIEIRAAAAVYGEHRPPERPLLVGSVKTNLGHLESAAGVAGLIKVILALESGEIPRHLNFETPSPHIDWAALPVRVTAEATPWPQAADRPPRAGISSFGFSGTNAHLVVEGYTTSRQEAAAAIESQPRLLPLSGRSEAAVRDLAERYLSWLDARPELDDSLLADMAWTATNGRNHFSWRSGLVFDDELHLRKTLTSVASGKRRPSQGTGSKVAFLFTGQGSQWAGMGQVLYERETVVRDILDRCDAAFKSMDGCSLLDVMFGSADAEGDIGETGWAQPALYALGVALARLWQEAGVRPSAVMGHSLGEITAAQIAGVLTLEDGLRFAAKRGALMGALPREGLMAAIFAPAARVAEAMEARQDISIAADNGTHQVVSGPRVAVYGLTVFFRSQGVRVELLDTSHAFHSALMEPMLDSLAVAAGEVETSPPSLPLVSNVTGGLLEDAPDAAYWRQQARGTVAFATGVGTLSSLGVDTLVEIGPQAVLAPLADACWPEEGGEVKQVASLVPGQTTTGFLPALAAAYEAGINLDLDSRFKDENCYPVSLPTYPFQRKRYWVETDAHPDTQPETLRSLANGQTVVEAEYSTAAHPWLSHYKVSGSTVLPAAIYQVLAVDAGIDGDRAVAVEALRIHAPPIGNNGQEIEEDPSLNVELQLVFERPTPDGARDFEIYGRERGDDAWALHADGKVTPTLQAESSGQLDRQPEFDLLRPESTVEDSEGFYGNLAEIGFAPGSAFRGIESFWLADGQAEGRIAISRNQGDAAADHRLKVLDAVYQMAVRLAGDTGGTLLLPVECLSCWLSQVLPDQLSCHISLSDQGEHENGGPARLLADATLLGDDREVIGKITGLSLKKAVLTMPVWTRDDIGSLLHEVEWRESSLAYNEQDEEPPLAEEDPGRRSGRDLVEPGSAGCWVIVSGGTGVARPLALELMARRQKVVLVRTTRFATPIIPGVRTVRIDPESRESWCGLFQSCNHRDAPLRGIVHMAALDPDRGQFTPDKLYAHAVALVQGFEDSRPEQVCRLRFVTRQALLPARGSGRGVFGSMLWGLARSIAREENHLRPGLIDIEATDRESLLHELDELLSRSDEFAVLLRGPSRFVPRLVPSRSRTRLPGSGPWQIKADPDGLLSELRAGECTIETPGAHEILVEMHATGLNFHDVLSAMRIVDPDAPLGLEFCGRVIAAGAEVQSLSVNDRVAGFATGTFGSRFCTRPELVVPAPPNLSSAALATIPTVFVTAELAFRLAGLRPDERVLIHAAAGGVGHAAIQIAQCLGARVFATASRAKHDYVKSLGVHRVFDSRSTRFGNDILDATEGRGVDVVLNSLTGEGFVEASLSCLGMNGRFVEISKRDIWSPEDMAEMRPDISCHTLAVDELVARGDEQVGVSLGAIMDRLSRGELTPVPHAVWPISDVGSAMEEMRSGRHRGKLVLTAPGLVDGRLREDRTYLVADGGGSIGIETVIWLAERGAGTIVLSTSRAAGISWEGELGTLRDHGVQVVVKRAELAQAGAAAAMIEGIAAELPPLAGVISGVIDPAGNDSSDEDLEYSGQELRSDVMAAWNLHQAVEVLDLEFFVLFAGLSGVLGHPDCPGLAATGSFLEQLAAYRRQHGLPGQVVSWGTWSRHGESGEKGKRSSGSQDDLESGHLTTAQLFGGLEHILSQGTSSSVVASLNASGIHQRSEREDPLFEAFLASAHASETGETELQEEQLAESGEETSEETRASLVRLVSKTFREVLRLEESPPPHVGFFELGMDSLTAADFGNRLNHELGDACSISATTVFDYPDVESLVDHLLDQLGIPEENVPAESSTTESEHERERQRVDNLSPEELLSELMGRFGETS